MFNYAEQSFESPALDLTYHLAPWDEPFFQGATAGISGIHVKMELEAAGAFEIFRVRAKPRQVGQLPAAS
jgi:hypothetical protein